MRTESTETNTIKWLRAWALFLIGVVAGLIYLYSNALDAIDWQQNEIYRLQQEVSDLRNPYGGGR